MKIRVTYEREYEMNVERIKRDFASEISEDMANDPGRSEESVLVETFHELCGFDRDQDHIDGKYVWLCDTHFDMDWNA